MNWFKKKEVKQEETKTKYLKLYRLIDSVFKDIPELMPNFRHASSFTSSSIDELVCVTFYKYRDNNSPAYEDINAYEVHCELANRSLFTLKIYPSDIEVEEIEDNITAESIDKILYEWEKFEYKRSYDKKAEQCILSHRLETIRTQLINL